MGISLVRDAPAGSTWEEKVERFMWIGSNESFYQDKERQSKAMQERTGAFAIFDAGTKAAETGASVVKTGANVVTSGAEILSYLITNWQVTLIGGVCVLLLIKRL